VLYGLLAIAFGMLMFGRGPVAPKTST